MNSVNMTTVVLIGFVAILTIVAFLFVRSLFKKPQAGPKTAFVSGLHRIEAGAAKAEVKADKPPSTMPEVEQIFPVDVDHPFNALIFDDSKHSFGERHVILIKNRDYGRPLLHFNNMIFWLHKAANGMVFPFPAPPHEYLEHSPGETYEAVRNTSDMRLLFGKQNLSEKAKVLLLILAGLAALFIMWMATQSSKKGGA